MSFMSITIYRGDAHLGTPRLLDPDRSALPAFPSRVAHQPPMLFRPTEMYGTRRFHMCYTRHKDKRSAVTTFNAAFSPQTNTLLRSGCNMAATGHETRSSYGQCRMRQRQIVAGGRNEHVPQPVNQHVLLRPCPEPSTDEGGKGCKGKGDCVRRQGLRR